jgi:hypothetical protein
LVDFEFLLYKAERRIYHFGIFSIGKVIGWIDAWGFWNEVNGYAIIVEQKIDRFDFRLF